ncbi:hypothetical protein [Proteus vulgaris]|uniref:Uncharacterized protein n=1 Tax=Proteus vulgaris TaxID=585 RepID=A0A6G6SG44_PROVU|nr:hypothetical protein [Proteus vulgaris]QIF92811.1 hypothetical protein GTH24_02445 [Proteus vulgaris]WIF72808.1 hypothetical protein QN092_02675 [Proteus vulgaris]CRL63451.1 hypothetical protein BN1805_02304 [Proteus vulgaris]
MNNNIISVITGDIIGSRDITPEDYDVMLYTLEQTVQLLSEQLPLKYDRYRGDSFQLVCSKANDAIKVAIVIQLALKTSSLEISARQSIGVGKVDSLRNDVRTSIGEAFILSGEGLDKMKGEILAISTSDTDFQHNITLVTKYLDLQLKEITRAQAQVLLKYMVNKDKSHYAIANELNKSRSNITRLLNASHYQLIDEYIQYFNYLINKVY